MELHPKPTIFHVTHWKAGSQWVRAVLEAAAPKRIVVPGAEFAGPIVQGGIYTPVYCSHDKFHAIVPRDLPQRTFCVLRDPRDTAVSWYFSLLYSHRIDDPSVKESRDILTRLNKTDGLALVICNHLRDAVAIQSSWIHSGSRVFRYEDLRADQQGGFHRLFDYCGLEVPDAQRRKIVARNSFERKTWWRRGRENPKSHLRKGAPGDWKNHFCDRLKKLFKIHYSDVLIEAGYEADDAW